MNIRSKCIALALCTLLMTPTFTACGPSIDGNTPGPASNNNTDPFNTSTPEGVISTTLNALKTFDVSLAEKYIDADYVLELDEKYLANANSEYAPLNKDKHKENALKDLTFTINSVTLSDDELHATANVTFTNVDMAVVLDEYMSRYLTEAMKQFSLIEEDTTFTTEDNEALLVKSMNEGFELARKENKQSVIAVDVQLQKNNDSWMILSDSALKNAIFGNAIEGLKAI